MSWNELGVPEAAVFDPSEYSGDPDNTETIVRGGQIWPRYILNHEGRLCDLQMHKYVPQKPDRSNALVFPEETNIDMVREHLGVLDF